MVLGLRIVSDTARKDLVLDLVPTPLQDGFFASAPSSSKTSKLDGVTPKIDKDWACEHAARLESALPGGVEVLGFYIYLSDKAMRSPQTVMQGTTLLRDLKGSLADCDSFPPVLLHLDATSRKAAAKSCEDGGAALKTVELRFTKIENNLVRVHSVYGLDSSPQVVATTAALKSKSALAKELSRWAERETGRLEGIVLRLGSGNGGGELVDEAAGSSGSVLDAVKACGASDPLDGGSRIGIRNLRFDIFCPAGRRATRGQGRRVQGRVRPVGSVTCVGYVYARDTMAAVAAALRRDVARSLRSRVESYLDDAAESAADERSGDGEGAVHPLAEAERDGCGGLRTPLAACLPSRRLFVKSGGGDHEITFSHYADDDDDDDEGEGASTLRDLLSLEGEMVAFEVGTREATGADLDVSVWHPMAAEPKPKAAAGTGGSCACCGGGGGQVMAAGPAFNVAQVVGAALILALALVIAYMLTGR